MRLLLKQLCSSAHCAIQAGKQTTHKQTFIFQTTHCTFYTISHGTKLSFVVSCEEEHSVSTVCLKLISLQQPECIVDCYDQGEVISL